MLGYPTQVTWIAKYGNRCCKVFPSIAKAKRFAYDTLQFDNNYTYSIERVYDVPQYIVKADTLESYIIGKLFYHYYDTMPWLIQPSNWSRID